MHRDSYCKRFDARPHPAWRVLVAVVILAAIAAGCSGSGSSYSLDAPRARKALTAALDGWKKGDAPSVFKDALPAMTVQDLDWMGGSKLLDYQIEGEGNVKGSNLHVPAKLTLRSPEGKESKKTVTYIIGTSPIVTVFRAFH